MLEAKHIIKKYGTGQLEQTVLRGIDLTVSQGEFVAIIGPSGAGKSTLMYQLSLLDHPSTGTVLIDDRDTAAMTSDERTAIRLTEFGYVFQDYALVPELTAAENIALPLLMQGKEKSEAFRSADAVLTQLGLSTKGGSLPSQLSGGQQQRVSIARAIAHNPKVLFADEPTANLDSESSLAVMKAFLELNAAGQTIVMVTHEMEFAEQAKRVVEMKDGSVVKDRKP